MSAKTCSDKLFSHSQVDSRGSKLHPCPCCGKPDPKCVIFQSGLILCQSAKGGRINPPPGFHYTHDTKDGHWGIVAPDNGAGFSRDYEPRRPADPGPAPVDPLKEAEAAAKRKWVKEHVEKIVKHRRPFRETVAVVWQALGLSLDAAQVLDVKQCGAVFTCPERDGAGKIIAHHTRNIMNGADKKTYGVPDAECKRGLIYNPDNFSGPDLAGADAFTVEGLTDTAAMIDMVFPRTAGRPSNASGGPQLAELYARAGYVLSGPCASRTIFVVGENDQKEKDDWPGKQGAEKIADDLMMEGFPNVVIVYPPPGHKDVRAFRIAMKQQGMTAAQAGELLREHFRKTAQRYKGPEPASQPASVVPLKIVSEEYVSHATRHHERFKAFDERLLVDVPSPLQEKLLHVLLWADEKSDNHGHIKGCGFRAVLDRKNTNKHVFCVFTSGSDFCPCCRTENNKHRLRSFVKEVKDLPTLFYFTGPAKLWPMIAQRILKLKGKSAHVKTDLETFSVFCDVFFPGCIELSLAEAIVMFHDVLPNEHLGDHVQPVRFNGGWHLVDESSGMWALNRLFTRFARQGKFDRHYAEGCGLKGKFWDKEFLPRTMGAAWEFECPAAKMEHMAERIDMEMEPGQIDKCPYIMKWHRRPENESSKDGDGKNARSAGFTLILTG